MYRVYLGLGSNIGDRLQFLTRALKEIKSVARICSFSSVYETEPVGMVSGSMFYNMAVCIETPDFPDALLKRLKQIEQHMGRVPGEKLRDRQIDIDILLYEGWMYTDAVITVPHPKLTSRRFVLTPLNEIAPSAVHPDSGKTVEALLQKCRDHSFVKKKAHMIKLTI